MLKHDLIMRMIEDIGALARRIARRKREHVPLEESLSDLEQTYDALFGLSREQVLGMEPKLLATFVRRDAEMPWLARVVRIDAETHRAAGSDRVAAALTVRAFALAAEAIRRETAPAQLLEDVGALLETLPPEHFALDDLQTVQGWLG